MSSMYASGGLQESLHGLDCTGQPADQSSHGHEEGLAFEHLFEDEFDLCPQTANPGEHATGQAVGEPLYNTTLAMATSANECPVSVTPTKEDWEANKDTITKLYAIEGRKLKEVIQIMEQKYGFYAT